MKPPISSGPSKDSTGGITTMLEQVGAMRQCPHWVGDIYRGVGLECPLCREQREMDEESEP